MSHSALFGPARRRARPTGREPWPDRARPDQVGDALEIGTEGEVTFGHVVDDRSMNALQRRFNNARAAGGFNAYGP